MRSGVYVVHAEFCIVTAVATDSTQIPTQSTRVSRRKEYMSHRLEAARAGLSTSTSRNVNNTRESYCQRE